MTFFKKGQNFGNTEHHPLSPCGLDSGQQRTTNNVWLQSHDYHCHLYTQPLDDLEGMRVQVTNCIHNDGNEVDTFLVALGMILGHLLCVSQPVSYRYGLGENYETPWSIWIYMKVLISISRKIVWMYKLIELFMICM